MMRRGTMRTAKSEHGLTTMHRLHGEYTVVARCGPLHIRVLGIQTEKQAEGIGSEVLTMLEHWTEDAPKKRVKR